MVKYLIFFENWNLSGDEGLISDINYNKFTNSAKIEIHGCNTGASVPIANNVCENISEYLYIAGKERSVVIGHSTKANPNLPTTIQKKKKQIKIGKYEKLKNRIIVTESEKYITMERLFLPLKNRAE